jgi:hypothetical protein
VMIILLALMIHAMNKWAASTLQSSVMITIIVP